MNEDIKEVRLDLDSLSQSANLQLSEIEMLQSMFPDQAEFSIEKEVIETLEGFVNGSSDCIPSGFEYAINLKTGKGPVSMHVAIPSSYPSESPDIYVRSTKMVRQEQAKLNNHLNVFLDTLEKGDLIAGSAISWLQENAEIYLEDDLELKKGASQSSDTSTKNTSFSRAWIYSHHIYSKVKRKDIRDLASEYNLSGFCLPGKPGIICVEGCAINVKDWWQAVRSWNWQKILLKRLEELDTYEENLHRFDGFQELGSNTNIRVKSSGYHVDMGDLLRYLEDHESGYMFHELFGLTAKQ